MSKRFRVLVEELYTDDDGVELGRTVVELAADGEQLARFAPGVVAETLGAERAAVTVVMPSDVPPPGTPGLDRLTALPPAETEPTTQVETPKRTRRTKAQKQADDEAQSLGYRDATHRAKAEAATEADSPHPTPTPEQDAAAEGGDAELASMATAVQQFATEQATSAPTFAAPQGTMPATVPTPPAGTVAPAYNPFA